MSLRKALYDPMLEWDAGGIGFAADARSGPSREIVDVALEALRRLRHRGAVAADQRTGDGAGVLLPISAALLPSPWCGPAMVFRGDEQAREGIEHACRPRASTPRAGVRCPSTRASSARRRSRAPHASSSSSSSGRGELFCAGRAGERFAVRRSGAMAVVEGTDDDACDYMTNGVVVVVFGETGRNVAAGTTGGELFVHGPDERLPLRLNGELAANGRPTAEDLDFVRKLVGRHARSTASARAAALLAPWEQEAGRWWRAAPMAEVAAAQRTAEGTAAEAAAGVRA